MPFLTAILLLTLWFGAVPTAVRAQPPALQVRLVDTQGVGVPGVIISLRDAGGAQALGEAMTNTHGEAVFTTLPTTTVRLMLHGTTASGTPITLGETSFLDDPAILVRTDVGSPLVALVLDAQGVVTLNPVVLESEGESIASVPMVANSAVQPPPSPAVVPPAASVPTIPPWGIVGIGIVLTVAAIGLNIAWRRRV